MKGNLQPVEHSLVCAREIPQELIRQARGREVNLNMADHRGEDFVKPKGTVKAFTGEGHMLGRFVHVCLLVEPY